MRQPSDQDSAKSDIALMSPNLLWGLLETADRIGAPSDDWFAGTGLSRAQVSDPVTADHPMSTGMQPAIPPQTMFCGVRRLRIIV